MSGPSRFGAQSLPRELSHSQWPSLSSLCSPLTIRSGFYINILSASLACLLTQSFYAWRLWRVSQHNIYLVSFIMIGSLMQLCESSTDLSYDILTTNGSYRHVGVLAMGQGAVVHAIRQRVVRILVASQPSTSHICDLLSLARPTAYIWIVAPVCVFPCAALLVSPYTFSLSDVAISGSMIWYLRVKTKDAPQASKT